MNDQAAQLIRLSDNRTLDFTGPALVMGIVNCTPDSFYPASRAGSDEGAVAMALGMIDNGADILDFGGESTRPGADYVSAEQQIARVVPVIEAVRRKSDIPISVDTRMAAVAEAAIDAGADIINDVSGLRDDPEMAALAARRNVPVILMHMRGTSRDMQKNPYYQDTIAEVGSELSECVTLAKSAGIEDDRIIIDPGIGFGKRLEDNLILLARIDAIRALGYPVLLGASRKSFINMVLEREVEDRLYGTLAAEAWAVIQGVEILRVHDVAPTSDMVRMLHAIAGVRGDEA